MASIQKRPDASWRARYRDVEGREHARHFERKVDAQCWLDGVTADIVTGRYVDPARGRTTLDEFAERWLAAQTFDIATRVQVTSRLRKHVLPQLGSMQLRAIKPSTVQAWVKGRSDILAPSTLRVLLHRVSGIFAAAVEDGLIATNPCASRAVSAPAVADAPIVPWTSERVLAVVAAHPPEYRAVPLVAAGAGLRQGEVFGLRVDDVEFLRRRLHVRHQVKLVGAKAYLDLPKRKKVRAVPLAATVADALAAGWPGGRPRTAWSSPTPRADS